MDTGRPSVCRSELRLKNKRKRGRGRGSEDGERDQGRRTRRQAASGDRQMKGDVQATAGGYPGSLAAQRGAALVFNNKKQGGKVEECGQS